jgi:putative aldouronate transport system substrate-binding protein
MKKRMLLIAMLLILSLMLVAGPATTQSEPTVIQIFSPQGAEADLATNAFTLMAEEMFNIKFEWTVTTYDATSAAEVRNLSLASGDYPEVFMLIPWVDQFSQVELLRYGQQGVLLPLNDLIEQHAPNIKAALEEYPDFRAMATAPDGTIWGLPQLVQCYHCSYANKMWVNRRWLEELGIPMPTTTEEFRDMLVAFREGDANGNGVADEVLGGAIMDYGTRPIPFLMNGFIYTDDRTYLILNDGMVDTVANKPEWKEGLAYIKSLYDEGLIDPATFTNNADAYSAFGNNASAKMLGAAAGMHPWIFVDCGDAAAPSYCVDYDPLPPLQGPNAAYATYLSPVLAGATFALTNKASEEVQIAAIKLVDYMFTVEGMLNAHYGVEGVNWRDPVEGEIANNRDVEPLFTTLNPDPATPNNAWGAAAQYFHPKWVRDGWVTADEIYTQAGYERRLQEATDLYAGKESPDLFPFWQVWPDPTLADELSLLTQNITDYIETSALGFVTGSMNLETDWDAYVQGLEGLGLARYLEINQQQYDASMN